MIGKKILSRTHFEQKNTPNEGLQWRWRQDGANGETLAVGSEGYHRIAGALNGFIAAQGFPGYGSEGNDMSSLPEGYRLEKLDSNHYVVIQYEDRLTDQAPISEQLHSGAIKEGVNDFSKEKDQPPVYPVAEQQAKKEEETNGK